MAIASAPPRPSSPSPRRSSTSLTVSDGTSSTSMGTRAMALIHEATSDEFSRLLSCMAARAAACATARAGDLPLRPSPQNSRRWPLQGTRPQSAQRHLEPSSGGPGRQPCSTQTRNGCIAWSFRMSAMTAACSPASSAVGRGGAVSSLASAARAAAERAALLFEPTPTPSTAVLPSKTRPQTVRCLLPPGAEKGSASTNLGPCSMPAPSLATIR
mmetsp:Transcript_88788/g.251646  ORF Transcript_88788/g.251646 Transcript_88788/m.251646 type:complete len:214 (+) Transcript_88788:88-729(+)